MAELRFDRASIASCSRRNTGSAGGGPSRARRAKSPLSVALHQRFGRPVPTTTRRRCRGCAPDGSRVNSTPRARRRSPSPAAAARCARRAGSTLLRSACVMAPQSNANAQQARAASATRVARRRRAPSGRRPRTPSPENPPTSPTSAPRAAASAGWRPRRARAPPRSAAARAARRALQRIGASAQRRLVDALLNAPGEARAAAPRRARRIDRTRLW